MQFTQINDGSVQEVVYGVYQNISGATVSAHVPVQLDPASATQFTASKSGCQAGLFLGVTMEALADSAKGKVQLYGFHSSAYVCRASAGAAVGDFLIPVAGYFDSATMSAATTSGHVFVTLLDTITASAAYSSAAQVYQHDIFVRAL